MVSSLVPHTWLTNLSRVTCRLRGQQRPQQLAVGWTNGVGKVPLCFPTRAWGPMFWGEGEVSLSLASRKHFLFYSRPSQHTVPPWHRHVVSDRETAREFGVPVSHGVPPPPQTYRQSFSRKGGDDCEKKGRLF